VLSTSLWRGFIGLPHIVTPLQKLADGAKRANQPLPPLLFYGPSGNGKDRLATAVAQEMGTTCFELFGDEKPERLYEVALAAKYRDVISFNEVHRLNKEVQELLYPWIDDSKDSTRCDEHGQPLQARLPTTLVPPKLIEGREDCFDQEKGKLLVACVTFIFASDQPGGLAGALQKRISRTHRFRITGYTNEELRQIGRDWANKKGLNSTPHIYSRLVSVSFGSPRQIKDYIDDLAFIYGKDVKLDVSHVDDYLKVHGIDPNCGITHDLRDCMELLRRRGPTPGESLAHALGTDILDYKRNFEEPLLYLGYLDVSPAGRKLTKAGEVWVDQHPARKETGM
jgi:Holliday junction resolvasome RuvABC ATP-dependent DNA helicase subunit